MTASPRGAHHAQHARRRLAALTIVALCGLPACRGGDTVSSSLDAPDAPNAPSAPAGSRSSTTAGPSPSVGASAGRAGGAGAGDPYFPSLGNEGYDVERYDVEFDYDGAVLGAVVTIDATPIADLDTFNLDFTDLTIEHVEVDGTTAPHRVDGEELVVDPAPVLRAGEPFAVTVAYRGRPQARVDPVLGRVGWQQANGVTFTSSEPYGAHLWLPSNDHPSDKAAFRFSITVDEGVVAVASGSLVSRDTVDGRTTWVWDHPAPMATYTAAVAIGDLRLVEAAGPNDIDIRHAFAPRLADAAEPVFAGTAEAIAQLEALFGPYPFDAYGALVLDADLGYAMENQTLSLFDRRILDGSLRSSRTIVHELAHHWFGNWVTPATWQDIWLNEGFASYAEELWLERVDPGYDVDAAMQARWRSPFGPIGDPGPNRLFEPASYGRGALTLHALRRTVGDDAFFAVLRAWVDHYGGSSATTSDFVALASGVAGTDVGPLVDEWLDAPTMPPLP